jgi:pyrroloquinoline quinone biosynthesis protein D
MKIFRNQDAQWREEDEYREKAYKGLESGEDVTEIGTSIVLYSGKMHSLNVLGTEIWKLCDGKTFDDIVSELKESFDVEEDVLREDVSEFLKSMKEEGLIHEE